MVEAGEDLGLPLEPGEPVRIVREGVGQDLQGDLAVEQGVGGLPDLAHAALTNEGGNVIVPEAGASGQGHGGVGSILPAHVLWTCTEPLYAQNMDDAPGVNATAYTQRAWIVPGPCTLETGGTRVDPPVSAGSPRT